MPNSASVARTSSTTPLTSLFSTGRTIIWALNSTLARMWRIAIVALLVSCKDPPPPPPPAPVPKVEPVPEPQQPEPKTKLELQPPPHGEVSTFPDVSAASDELSNEEEL